MKTTEDFVDDGRRIRAVVADGLNHWRRRTGAASAAGQDIHAPGPTPESGNGGSETSNILTSMPRREKSISFLTHGIVPPGLRSVPDKVGVFRSLGRLFKWFYLINYILGGYLWDRLLRRNSVELQASRLRKALEDVGGTFIKLGQQAAMRIDFVPWEYCVELSKLLDRMQPFPVEKAFAAIRRATGKSWDEVFSVFDPNPVGSASVACVYQATLKDGTRVAVKVRRPGIVKTFLADFRVMNWCCGLLEGLAIIRPGFTRNLRREFQDTLMEELDFIKEARFQDIFRRNARKKSGKRFFTAPRVYFELCSDEVLVQEFVSGIWLWEVIAALERNDQKQLMMMRRMNIDPRLVARRILWVCFWGIDENLFFHADPHPANIVVGRNSKLTFIDFGSCGSFNDDQRDAMDQIVSSMERDDALGMTRGVFKLLEPIPPVDVSAVIKAGEAEHMRALTIFRTKAKYTEWWERSSARQWLVVMKLARTYNLPLNLNTLRLIRATLLYDTLALRLDRQIDRYKEYARFKRYRTRFEKARFEQRLRTVSGDELFSSIKVVSETADDLLYRARHFLAFPLSNFAAVIDKWIFAFAVLSRMVGRIITLTAVTVVLVSLIEFLRVGSVDIIQRLFAVVDSTLYRGILLVFVVLSLRPIIFRMRDRDALN